MVILMSILSFLLGCVIGPLVVAFVLMYPAIRNVVVLGINDIIRVRKKT